MKNFLKKISCFIITLSMILGSVTVVFAGGEQEVVSYIANVTTNSLTIKFSGDKAGSYSCDQSFIQMNFDKNVLGFGFGPLGVRKEEVTQLPLNNNMTVYVPVGTKTTINFSDDISKESVVLKDFGFEGLVKEVAYSGASFVPYEQGNTRMEYKIRIPGYQAESNMINFCARTSEEWKYDVENQASFEKVYTTQQMKSMTGMNETIVIPKGVQAIPTGSKTTIDGKEVSFQAYTINNYTYLKLRDVAMAVNGTEKNFAIEWDNDKKAINISTKQPYSPVGGEMSLSNGGNKEAIKSAAVVYVDNTKQDLKAYTIDGNTYFQLRDIGKLIDFDVAWDNVEKTIQIDTTNGYMSE